MSSVKAIADTLEGVLTEETEANPQTPYGKSKRAAEEYILSKKIPRIDGSGGWNRKKMKNFTSIITTHPF